MSRLVLFTAIAAGLAVVAEVAGPRLDPDALRGAAPVWLWLGALVAFAAPRRVPAREAPPGRDPVEALVEGVALAGESGRSGAFVGAVLPLAALAPAWCAAARWWGAPGDLWPLAALALAAVAAGGLAASGRSVGALGALVAAAVALGVGPDGWARVLGTESAPPGTERPSALLGVTLSLEGPMAGAEVAYAGVPPLEIDADLTAGEGVVVRGVVPGPPLDRGALDPLAGDPDVTVDGDGADPGEVTVRTVAPPAALDAVAKAALARARPPAATLVRGGSASRTRVGWVLLLVACGAALGGGAAAAHIGPIRGLAATALLTAGVGLVPVGGAEAGSGESSAPSHTAPIHTVHEGQRLAEGGVAWWTVRRVALPARIEEGDLDRVRALPGARAPRCRVVVRDGQGAVWLLPPTRRPAAVDIVGPAEALRFAVLAPEVNTLGDFEAAWWRGADGAVAPLGPWPRGAPRPEPVPGGPPPPEWAFAGAPVGREGALGRLSGGAWVRLAR